MSRSLGSVPITTGPAALTLQAQRLRHAAAERNQPQVLHHLQTVVPPQGLRETHVSVPLLDSVTFWDPGQLTSEPSCCFWLL